MLLKTKIETLQAIILSYQVQENNPPIKIFLEGLVENLYNKGKIEVGNQDIHWYSVETVMQEDILPALNKKRAAEKMLYKHYRWYKEGHAYPNTYEGFNKSIGFLTRMLQLMKLEQQKQDKDENDHSNSIDRSETGRSSSSHEDQSHLE